MAGAVILEDFACGNTVRVGSCVTSEAGEGVSCLSR